MRTSTFDAAAASHLGLDLLFGLVRAMISGWAYLLSPRFRAWTHLRWERQREMKTAMEVVAGLCGLVFSCIALLWLSTWLA